MKAISTYIQLGSVTLQICDSFTIESTWDNFTDTAMISVPNVIFKSETSNASVGLDSLLQRGDPVEIRAGYNKSPNQLESLFKGYISDITTGTILRIKAQDAMYALKQKNLPSRLFKSVTLGELIDYITDGINIETKLIDPDVVLGDWAIENNSFMNSVAVLQELKSKYGFVSYIKDGILNVGVAYDANNKTHFLLKELNFAGADNLVSRSNDTLLVLKGQLMNPDNSSTYSYVTKVNEEIVISEAEIQGETRAQVFYNMTVAEMEDTLKRRYQTTNFEGLKGDFSTFGEPVIKYNDYIKLRDLKNPERNGTYKVRKVIYELTTSGGLRQNCTIDFGISEIQANS